MEFVPDGPGWTLVDSDQEAEQRERVRRKAEALRRGDLDALAQFQAIDQVEEHARQSGGIYAVQHDDTHVYRTRDGRLQAGVNWILSASLIDKIRHGYACLICTEEFRENGLPTSFPEQCPVCGFAVRAEQATQLAKDMRADEHVGEDETPAETEARWAWEKAERRWRRTGGQGILIPRGVRL